LSVQVFLPYGGAVPRPDDDAAVPTAASSPEPHWLSDDEQRTWRAFLAFGAQLDEALDRQLQRDAGMPHAYYQVLAMLSEAPGRSMRMSELARITSSSPSRLSHAVSRLEERGWVRRDRHPTDRRGAVAVLTDDGYAAVVAAAPGHVAAVREVFFDRVDEAQLAVLREVFEELAEEGGVGPDLGG
jgi:DNA-binding MarR family transcriptional regulator